MNATLKIQEVFLPGLAHDHQQNLSAATEVITC